MVLNFSFHRALSFVFVNYTIPIIYARRFDVYIIGAHDVGAKRFAPILELMLDIFNTFNYINDLSCRLSAFKLRSTEPAAACG